MFQEYMTYILRKYMSKNKISKYIKQEIIELKFKNGFHVFDRHRYI